MRNRTGILVGVALALSVAAVLAPAAGADARKPRSMRSDLLRMEAFNVSGEFTGTLAGEIRLGGVTYPLATRVQIYEIGNGLIPAGSYVESRYIFISGVRTMGAGEIFSIMVRPATVPSLDQDDLSAHLSSRPTTPGED